MICQISVNPLGILFYGRWHKKLCCRKSSLKVVEPLRHIRSLIRQIFFQPVEAAQSPARPLRIEAHISQVLTPYLLIEAGKKTHHIIS